MPFSTIELNCIGAATGINDQLKILNRAIHVHRIISCAGDQHQTLNLLDFLYDKTGAEDTLDFRKGAVAIVSGFRINIKRIGNRRSGNYQTVETSTSVDVYFIVGNITEERVRVILIYVASFIPGSNRNFLNFQLGGGTILFLLQMRFEVKYVIAIFT